MDTRFFTNLNLKKETQKPKGQGPKTSTERLRVKGTSGLAQKARKKKMYKAQAYVWDSSMAHHHRIGNKKREAAIVKWVLQKE